MSSIEFSSRLTEKLDKLTSLAKGDKRDFASNDKTEPLVKLRFILDRLRILLIKLKRNFVSLSPILFVLRLREKL